MCSNGNRKQVTCDRCDKSFCKECCKRYILSLKEEPHCMECKAEWSTCFIRENISKSFANKELLDHLVEIAMMRIESREQEGSSITSSFPFSCIAIKKNNTGFIPYAYILAHMQTMEDNAISIEFENHYLDIKRYKYKVMPNIHSLFSRTLDSICKSESSKLKSKMKACLYLKEIYEKLERYCEQNNKMLFEMTDGDGDGDIIRIRKSSRKIEEELVHIDREYGFKSKIMNILQQTKQ